MKKKILSAALAAVLAVTCLAGCSAGFTTDKVIKAANDYGMTKGEDFTSFLRSKNNGVPSYYVSKDSTEATELYKYTFSSAVYEPNEELERLVVCMEVEKQDEPKPATVMDGVHTYIFAMSAKDTKSAKSIYDHFADWMKTRGGKEESKNGYTYIICQRNLGLLTGDDSEGTNFSGIYINGKNLIYIEAEIGDSDTSKCAESFCKELGLVSPLTLKK